MLRVIIESPFRGQYARNRAYLLLCIRDSLSRGEAPFASHLFYTEVLDDREPEDRTLGIEAGLAWAKKADLVAVYEDLGQSAGMKFAIARHEQTGVRVEYRRLTNGGGFLDTTA